MLDNFLKSKLILYFIILYQNNLTACNYSYIQLIDFNARFYSPRLGRFIQPDTLIPNPTNPQSLNRFSYALNNPVKYIDPSGNMYLEAGYGRLKDDLDEDIFQQALDDFGVEIDQKFSDEQAGVIYEVLEDYSILLGGAGEFKEQVNTVYIGLYSGSIWDGIVLCGGACTFEEQGSIYLTNVVIQDPLGFINENFANYKNTIWDQSAAFAFVLAHELTHNYTYSEEGGEDFSDFKNAHRIKWQWYYQNPAIKERGSNYVELFSDAIAAYMYLGSSFGIFDDWMEQNYPSLNMCLIPPNYE